MQLQCSLADAVCHHLDILLRAAGHLVAGPPACDPPSGGACGLVACHGGARGVPAPADGSISNK
eukprot:8650501-Pyramimonas_sp.AAC.1